VAFGWGSFWPSANGPAYRSGSVVDSCSQRRAVICPWKPCCCRSSHQGSSGAPGGSACAPVVPIPLVESGGTRLGCSFFGAAEFGIAYRQAAGADRNRKMLEARGVMRRHRERETWARFPGGAGTRRIACAMRSCCGGSSQRRLAGGSGCH